MVKIITMLALALFAVRCYALDWQTVATSTPGESGACTWAINLPTAVDSGGIRRIWVGVTCEKPLERNGKSIASMNYLYEFDCPGQQFRIRQRVGYDGRFGSGEVVDSQKYSKAEFESDVPDSIGSAVRKAVCGLKLSN